MTGVNERRRMKASRRERIAAEREPMPAHVRDVETPGVVECATVLLRAIVQYANRRNRHAADDDELRSTDGGERMTVARRRRVALRRQRATAHALEPARRSRVEYA